MDHTVEPFAVVRIGVEDGKDFLPIEIPVEFVRCFALLSWRISSFSCDDQRDSPEYRVVLSYPIAIWWYLRVPSLHICSVNAPVEREY